MGKFKENDIDNQEMGQEIHPMTTTAFKRTHFQTISAGYTMEGLWDLILARREVRSAFGVDSQLILDKIRAPEQLPLFPQTG